MSPSAGATPRVAHRALARCALALAAVAAGATSAAAQSTVDFNGLADPGASSSIGYVDNCYMEGGLTFAIAGLSCGTTAAFGYWSSSAAPIFYTGSPALFNNSGATVEITSGGTFSLNSVSLAPYQGLFSGPTTVMFMGMLAGGGTVTQEFMVPGGTTDLATFTFSGFTDLSAASYTVTDPTAAPYVQIDDLMFSSATAVVPEPATLGLVGFGLVGVGAFVRRRRRGA